MKFDKSLVVDLKHFLYNSHVHDSVIEHMEYKWEAKEVLIKIVNPIWHEKITFVFTDVVCFLVVTKNELGNREAINSLTVEDEMPVFIDYNEVCSQRSCENLYLLFQMFSDDEIHIISKDAHISVENIDVATEECETINYGKNLLL